MRSQILIGGGLIVNRVGSKLKVATSHVFLKLSPLGQLSFSWFLEDSLLDVIHGSFVERYELVRNILIVLDLEVRSVVNGRSIFLRFVLFS